jgi:hypothetical protein
MIILTVARFLAGLLYIVAATIAAVCLWQDRRPRWQVSVVTVLGTAIIGITYVLDAGLDLFILGLK